MNHRPTKRSFQARRPGRTGFAGSSGRFVATAIATVPLLTLLALLLAVNAVRAQEMPGGIKVGDGEVSIEGAGVYAGNGCAKAGPVTAGDCEKAEKDGGDEADGGASGGQGDDMAPEITAQEMTQLLTEMEGTTTGFGESASPAPAPETTLEDTLENTASSAPASEEGCAAERPMGKTTTTIVEEVADGDTLETPEGTVRLIGVDTPETVDPDQPPEPGGEEASGFTTDALEGEEVELELGEETEDDYGRALAYAWTDEGMFNELLLREGYGELLIIEPNDAYEECLAAAEAAARGEGLGIWGEGSASPEAADPATTFESTAETTAAPGGEGDGRQGLLGRLFGGGADEQPDEAAQAAPATTGLTVLEPSSPSGSTAREQYDETQPPVDGSQAQEEKVQEPEVQEPETQEGLLPPSTPEPQATAPSTAPVAEPAVLQTPAEVYSESPAPTSSASPAPAQTISTLPETGGLPLALSLLPLLAGVGLPAAAVVVSRRRAANRG